MLVDAGWSYESVEWRHWQDRPDHPFLFVSEVDANRRERRTVQLFPDGSLGFATGFAETPRTRLAEHAVPPLDLINADEELHAIEISRVEFDAWWSRALASSESWTPRRDGLWLPLVRNYLPRAFTAFEDPDYLHLESVDGDDGQMLVHRLREADVLGSCAFDAVETIGEPLGVVLVDDLVFSQPATRERNIVTTARGAVHVGSIAPA